MKKNFVKKLALGLALVMAVTSVPTTSEAASKPAFKTASVEVKEGETVKAVVKGTKGYTVKKVASKDETVATVAKVAQKAKKTNVKVTGVKAGETTVVAKLAKGGKTVKAKLAVTVKAEEKTTMTVEATGVREITAKFNKAIDATSTVTVKKGSATPTYTAKLSEDGKTLVLAMGGKLTKGTYDITVGELTGSVTVEDEKVTSIEIDKELIATSATIDSTGFNYATVDYVVKNQYGERMAGDVTVSCSLGTLKEDGGKACNTKHDGTAKFKMSAVLFCVPGTKGTVTVVEKTTGVTATQEVVYSNASTATTMEVIGVLDTKKAVLPATITAGRDASDYALYVQVLDQYGNSVSAVDFKKVANITVADSTTGLDIDKDNIAEDPENEDYLVIPFKASASNTSGKVKSGKLFVSIVNTTLGALYTGSFEAVDSVLLGSFNVYADSDVYNSTNVLSFEAIDKNGNEVKDYATLNNLVKFGANNTDTAFTWDENLDGSATLQYTPNYEFKDAKNLKEYTYMTHTIYVNGVDLTQQFVKTVQFTVKEARIPVAVTGLASGAYTAVDNAADAKLEIAAKYIKLEDQYGNEFSSKEAGKLGEKVTYSIADGYITGSGTAKDGVVGTVKEGGKTESSVLTMYVTGYQEEDDAFEVKLYPVDTKKATNLEIECIKYNVYTEKDNVLQDTESAAITSGSAIDLKISVTGKVGGKAVEIPYANYKITSASTAAIDAKTEGYVAKTATLEITVDTYEGPVVLTKEFTYSNIPSTLNVLLDKTFGIGSDSTKKSYTTDELKALFIMQDQYGDNYAKSDVKYTVRITDANGNKNAKVINNGTQYATISGLEAGDKVFVTATKGELKAMAKVTIK